MPNEARLHTLTDKFILETERRTDIRYAIARAELLLLAAEVDRLEKQVEKQTQSEESKERIAALKARSRVLFRIVERGPAVLLVIDAPSDALRVVIEPPYRDRVRLYRDAENRWAYPYPDQEDVPTSALCIIVHRDGRIERRVIAKTTIVPAPHDPYAVKPE
jgi:hypothetical protein